MTDIVSVWNLALSHLGIGTEVQSETEDTTEANACRRFFEQARDEMLSDYPWPFATITVELAEVAADPTSEWAFSYRYPTDCLKFQRIIGPVRNESRNSRISYLIQGDGTGGMLLFTDYQNSADGTFGVYTQRQDDPTYWPPGFVKALAYQLASYIGARVTSGDPMKLANRAELLQDKARAVAMANSVNEEQMEVLPESEFILAREDGGDSVTAPTNTFLTQNGQS